MKKVIKQVLSGARALIFCLLVSGMVSQQLSAAYENSWLVPSKKTIAIGTGALAVAWAGHGYWNYQRKGAQYKKAAKIIETIPQHESPLNAKKPQASLTYNGLNQLQIKLNNLQKDLGLGKGESNLLKTFLLDPLSLFFPYPYSKFLNNYKENIETELENRDGDEYNFACYMIRKILYNKAIEESLDLWGLILNFKRTLGQYFSEVNSAILINKFNKEIMLNEKIILNNKIDILYSGLEKYLYESRYKENENMLKQVLQSCEILQIDTNLALDKGLTEKSLCEIIKNKEDSFKRVSLDFYLSAHHGSKHLKTLNSEKEQSEARNMLAAEIIVASLKYDEIRTSKDLCKIICEDITLFRLLNKEYKENLHYKSFFIDVLSNYIEKYYSNLVKESNEFLWSEE